MKITLLTTTNSHLAGGLYNSVRSLGIALQKQDCNVELMSYNDKYSEEDLPAYGTLPLKFYNISGLPLLNKLGYSNNLFKQLHLSQPDIIHSQGIWMYNSKVARDYKRKYAETKLIVTPRGMLDSWAVANSKWKKKIVGHWFEYSNLKEADCIHVLCQSELESVRKFGLTNKIAVIPNGIFLPSNIIKREKKVHKTLLFISRIHPKKGLSQMIEALRIIKGRSDMLEGWEIKIAGWNQNGHQEELESLIGKYGLEKYVRFIGPVLSEKKHEELSNADAFILPSFSEGLPMSILEAWSYKLPVVMTDFCNLPEGFESKAAIRIDTTPTGIASGLEKLFKMNSVDLIQMGQNGLDLVTSKFTWEAIAKDVIQLYKYLLGKVDKPSFVYE